MLRIRAASRIRAVPEPPLVREHPPEHEEDDARGDDSEEGRRHSERRSGMVQGIGEARREQRAQIGCAASPAMAGAALGSLRDRVAVLDHAISIAVADALGPLGPRLTELPYSPERIFSAGRS